MILRQKFPIGILVLASLVASSVSHPYGVLYDDDYVDEDEAMDPPTPYRSPSPMGFAKKSSPSPVLSYPTAFDGAHHNLKSTPSSLLQNLKFKVPEPIAPVFSKAPKPVQQDEIPAAAKPLPPLIKSVPIFVTLPPNDEPSAPPSTTPKPLPKSPQKPQKATQVKGASAEALVKKIRPASSVVSPKYTHYPTHTLATFPQNQLEAFPHQGQLDSFSQGQFSQQQNHPGLFAQQGQFPQYQSHPSHGHSYQNFAPTIEPTYQMVPAAQQEYNLAAIGGVGLLSGGPVVSHAADESGESSADAAGQHYKQSTAKDEGAHDKDAKYEFMYRVQGDGKTDYDLKSEPSDFGHSEAREGDRTWGRYFVKLPDGRVQTVKYWADHTGYHAEVLFQGEAKHPDDPLKDGGKESFSQNSSPAFHSTSSYPSVSEADEPYKQQLPVSYAQAQDVPVAYAHAPNAPDSFDHQERLLGHSLKPLYSSQPTFVAPPNFYLGAASERVKAVEKPPPQQKQPTKIVRKIE